ncbi:MAG: TonB-dependent receptor [Ignavibacteriaceae bacterium]|nr:TonB-dependent receptor [Ignavibacteriaceae bacterium]
MPFLFSLVSLLMIFSYSLSAQNVKILDATSGESLPATSITNTNFSKSVISNSKGVASISSFIGEDSLIIRHIGFKTEIVSYEILSSKPVFLLNRENINLDEIIVSANKWEQTASDIPYKVESVSMSEISFYNPQNAADLLELTGKVFIQKSQQAGGSPMIRGFSTNRVLIVVDGVRMNNAIFRSGNIQNVIVIDGGSLLDAEVLFGPGSVMYGSDAIGGVMDFHTIKPFFSYNGSLYFDANASFKFSTANNGSTAGLNFNLGWEKFSSLTALSYSDFGDVKMGSTGPDEYLRNYYQERINGNDSTVPNPDNLIQKSSGYSQFNILQKFALKVSDNLLFDLGIYHSGSSNSPRYDRLIEFQNPSTLRSAEWYYGPQEWSLGRFTITNSNPSSYFDRFSLTLAAQRSAESRYDRRTGNNFLRENKEEVNLYSFNFDLDKSITGGLTLFYGIESIFNFVTSSGQRTNIVTGAVQPVASRYPDGSKTQSYAAYLVSKYKLSDKIILNAGLRYTYYTLSALFDTTFYKFPFTDIQNNNGAFNGSIGAVYKPSKNTNVYANISTGFRAPNIDDIGKVFDSEPGSVIVPNPALKPETALNFETGAAQIFGDFLKTDLSLFYTILSNAIVRREGSFNGADSIDYGGVLSKVLTLSNAASAYVWGIQAGILAELSKNFSISGNLNYQTGEEDDEITGQRNPLRHSAPFFSNLNLRYSTEGFTSEIYLIYNSEISFDKLAISEREKTAIYALDQNNKPYSPDWFTLNLKSSYKVSHNLKLFFGIENILDKRYRPYSSGIVAPGRNFIFSFQAGL